MFETLLIIFIVFVGLSLLILGHEGGHFLVAKLFGLKVEEFGFGFPPRIFARRPKNKNGVPSETEYSLNWLPFGGFVKISGENGEFGDKENYDDVPAEEKKRYFRFQPTWKKISVIFAGVFINFIIGWLLLSFILMLGTPRLTVITDVQANSPAQTAGLQAGDVLSNYSSAENFVNFINQNRGRQISFQVERGGQKINVSAEPRVITQPGEGALGIELADAGTPQQSFFPAIYNGFKQALLASQMIFYAFYSVIKSLFLHGSLLAGVVGPVGIFSVAEQTGRMGLIYLVQLISLISLNLAVINIIPFPALDGGRIFVILLEKIKGSPLSQKTEALVNGLGFAFLLLLIVLITIRDIGHLI